MPMSMYPDLMADAICATACNPLEHCLLTVIIDEVSGMPAWRDAIRAKVAPPPGGKTLPTTTSSISFGSILVLAKTPFKTVESIISAWTWAKAPRRALVTGLLKALMIWLGSKSVRYAYYYQTITTSSADLTPGLPVQFIIHTQILNPSLPTRMDDLEFNPLETTFNLCWLMSVWDQVASPCPLTNISKWRIVSCLIALKLFLFVIL